MKGIIEVIGILVLDLLLIIGIGTSFSVVFIISAIWLLYGLVIIKRLAHKQKKKWLTVLSKIYSIGVAFFVGSFVLIEGFLIFNMLNYKPAEKIEDLKYVIVLGAGLKGEEVSNTLKVRLDEAIKYYKLHPDTTIIVSGGQGPDEVISEAEAMKRYLEKNGIPKEHILKEDQSTTTFENIAFSKSILEERHDQSEKVLIVTNDYHLFRAQMIAYFMEIKSCGLAAISPLFVRMNYLVREYPTLIIHFFEASML